MFLLIEKGAQYFILPDEFSPVRLAQTISCAVERHQRTREIQEELRILSLSPEKNPNPVMRVDGGSILKYANAGSLPMLQQYHLAVGEPIASSWWNKIQELSRGKPGGEFEIKCGGRIYAMTVVWIDRGCFFYLYGNDVTEKKRMESIKDEFISTVSHELRTPLSIVKTAAGNLSDGLAGELSAEQARTVKMLERNIDRLSQLVDNLLDLSRLESGRLKLRKQRVHLADLLSESLLHFQQEIQERGLVLKFNVPRELPDLHVDDQLIHQLLSNLLSNALRYAKREINISARALSKRGKGRARVIELKVSDDGNGIPIADQKRLFDKFEQLERGVGAGYKGTGLGLAICKQIVLQHGGEIGVKNLPGKGACFFCTLPVYREGLAFREALNAAVLQSRENESPMALLALQCTSLDALKSRCSQQEVEGMLTGLKQLFQERVLRKTDRLLTPDEGVFMILFADTDHDGAAAAAKRLQEVVEGVHCVDRSGGKIFASFSFGIARCPSDAVIAEILVNKALEQASIQGNLSGISFDDLDDGNGLPLASEVSSLDE